MNRATTWLVGTEEDRRRIRETEAIVTGARHITVIAIVAVLPFLAGDRGLWILAVGAAYVAYTRVVDRMYKVSEWGDVWMMSLTLVTQAMFGACTAATGGPTSPAQLWLVVAMILLPARYGRNGIVVGSVFSLVCLVGASLSHGLDAFRASPELFFVTLSTGISCLAYGTALRKGEVKPRRAAVLDPLTGLLNRANLDTRFDEVQQLAVARGRTVGLLVCDLDLFKAVNDHHGHAVGDAVLRGIADELRSVFEDHELIYRLGGEEFAVVLPDTTLGAATAHGERVRGAVVAARPAGIDITISIGAAVSARDELTFETLYAAADGALYDAKRRGRNRVVAVDLGADELVEVPLAA